MTYALMPGVLTMVQPGCRCAHMPSLKLGTDMRLSVRLADREALLSALRTTSVALSPEGVAGTWCATAAGSQFVWGLHGLVTDATVDQMLHKEEFLD